MHRIYICTYRKRHGRFVSINASCKKATMQCDNNHVKLHKVIIGLFIEITRTKLGRKNFDDKKMLQELLYKRMT